MIVAGIDIETTGLEQEKGHRIIEFCASLYDLETRKFHGTYTKRINPQRPIDIAAQRVHGISMDDLIGAPVWEEVAPTVQKILRKADLAVAHNGMGFDLPFIAMELIRIGKEVPQIEVFDTMLESRIATPYGKLPRLKELCFAFEVEYDTKKAHAAEYDVAVMMECFFRGIDWGVYSIQQQEEVKAA